MKRQLILILLLMILIGCQTNSNRLSNADLQTNESLTVSAAVSLRDAFNEIGNLFKSKTGQTINFNFGASGALQQQIVNGAPVDIFASAGEKQMDELAAKKLILDETRRNFAKNTLVVIVPMDSKLDIKDFSDLLKAGVQKIAVGNPKTVPAGQYTEQVFDKSNLKIGLQSKLIFAEDVRQVLDYVVRGEVDAGIVYVTDANNSNGRVRIVATATENSHDPILYPIAVIKDSKQNQAAQEFINIVLNSEGQAILSKYGFAATPPK